MSRDELERLSKDELIEVVLRLQRPEKTSRTSSKPPATDRKEKRENAKPGGAKPGHEGHSRTLERTAGSDHRSSSAGLPGLRRGSARPELAGEDRIATTLDRLAMERDA